MTKEAYKKHLKSCIKALAEMSEQLISPEPQLQIMELTLYVTGELYRLDNEE